MFSAIALLIFAFEDSFSKFNIPAYLLKPGRDIVTRYVSSRLKPHMMHDNGQRPLYLKTDTLMITTSVSFGQCGGAMASWLVLSTPDRAALVRALAGDIVLCTVEQGTLLSQCLSPPNLVP